MCSELAVDVGVGRGGVGVGWLHQKTHTVPEGDQAEGWRDETERQRQTEKRQVGTPLPSGFVPL